MKPARIIHLDMDAFYASVEVLDNPSLRGKPVIVGGDAARGVVSAASYAARRYGVHSAMPVAMARKRCPHGIFLPPRMARYQEISRQIMNIFSRFTPLVEPLSLDEAFLDVSGSEKLFGPAPVMAEEIRRLVREETGLTVSAGVADSKLTAKIASDLNKPDGLTIVETGRSREFLAPLMIKKLWGVGKKTRQALKLLGVRTIGDLAQAPLELLTRKFGKHGQYLHNAAQAIDRRRVEPGRTIKSMGHEETFASDLLDLKTIKKELLALSVKVGKRLRQHGREARTVTIKTKYFDFKQTTRSKTHAEATNDDRILYRTGCPLLKETLAGKKPIRLLGISASNLVETRGPRQVSLLADEEERENRDQLNIALDRITGKFGQQSLQPGSLLPSKTKTTIDPCN